MKITIGSLIRKELSDPDSHMSQRVRQFKAWAYLSKHNPNEFKISRSEICRSNYYYFIKEGKHWKTIDSCFFGHTIGSLLNLI
jgi:hypothetical protein